MSEEMNWLIIFTLHMVLVIEGEEALYSCLLRKELAFISIYLACWLIDHINNNGLQKKISAKARLSKDLGSIAPKCAWLPLSAKASKTPFSRAWGSRTTSVQKLQVSVWCIPRVPRCSCRTCLAGWFYAGVGPQARHTHQKQGGTGGANRLWNTRSCHGGLDVCSKP